MTSPHPWEYPDSDGNCYMYASDCDHLDDYDIDWEGDYRCNSCGYSRAATMEETQAYDQWQREYAEVCERENKWWRRAWRRLMEIVPSWPRRRSIPIITDDDIPF